MEHFNQPHMPENSLHPSSPRPPLRQDSRHDSSVSRGKHDDKPVKTEDTGKSDEMQKTGFAKFFSGISWVQILSGGLAAVIVFLLSARLGFAGTIVGAALASMISTFSSQFFQNILNESEKKIKKVAKNIPSPSSEQEDVNHTPRVASNIAVVRAQEEQTTAMEPPLPSVVDANANLNHSHKGATGSSEDTSTISSTSLMPPLPSNPTGSSRQSQQADVNSPMLQTTSADSVLAGEASGESQSASSQHVTKKGTDSAKHRKTVILSLVATLVSVLLVAGGILLMTHGKGTGPVVPSTRIEKSDDSKRTPQKQSTTPSQNSGSTETQNSNRGTDNNSDSQSSQSQTQTPSQSDQNSNSGSSSSNSNDSNSSSDSSGTNSGQSDNGAGSSGSDSANKDGSSNGSGTSKDDSSNGESGKDNSNSSNPSTDDSSKKSDKSSSNSNDQSSANNSSSK